MNEAKILEMAKAIVDAQRNTGKTPHWGARQHIGLLANVSLALAADKADKLTYCKTLDIKGLGGNASQFRQWLNSAKGLGVGTFPENASLDTYA